MRRFVPKFNGGPIAKVGKNHEKALRGTNLGKSGQVIVVVKDGSVQTPKRFKRAMETAPTTELISPTRIKEIALERASRPGGIPPIASTSASRNANLPQVKVTKLRK